MSTDGGDLRRRRRPHGRWPNLRRHRGGGSRRRAASQWLGPTAGRPGAAAQRSDVRRGHALCRVRARGCVLLRRRCLVLLLCLSRMAAPSSFPMSRQNSTKMHPSASVWAMVQRSRHRLQRACASARFCLGWGARGPAPGAAGSRATSWCAVAKTPCSNTYQSRWQARKLGQRWNSEGPHATKRPATQ